MNPSHVDNYITLISVYATGASIHEATGKAVVVAFNAGNIVMVVHAIRNKYPDLQITIAADNDCWNNANTGRRKAEEAAEKYLDELSPLNINVTSDKSLSQK